MLDQLRSLTPGEYEEATRHCLLDTLGCILYGATLEEGERVLEGIASFGAGSIPLPGSSVRLTPDAAALAMGTLAHLRELDDVHVSIIHPGAVIVPAAWCAAYDLNLTLGELLDAIFVGYEAAARISRGINYLQHREQGWHGTATICPFGAALAVAHLQQLDRRSTLWALGIAGTRSGGTWAFAADGAMTKRLHPGMAARDGLQAAYLAKRGITGPEHILQAEDGGLYPLMSRDWDLTHLWADQVLPAVRDIEFKWYASCKSVHSPQEAATALYQQRMAAGLRGEVQSVKVQINSSAMHMAGRMYDPASITSAQLSIPYGIALALSGRDGSAANYTPELLADEGLYRLASLVTMEVSPVMDELRLKEQTSSANVEVFWQDGTTSREFVKAAKGTIEKPLTGAEILTKFYALAGSNLGEEGSHRLARLITQGERSLPVREIV